MYVDFRTTVLSTVLLLSFLLITHRAEALDTNHNISVGAGIPYGFIGVNYGFEMNLTNTFAIIPSVAVGTTITAGASSEIGLSMLFRGKNERIRYGFSLWNGTNTVLKIGESTYVSEEGITAGINLRLQLGANKVHGIDFYVLQAITPTNDELEQKYSVKRKGLIPGRLFGTGYVYRF